MCGIFGVVAKDHVNQTIFDALTMLQHRGQDAAGMATHHNGIFTLQKKNGLVRDVIHTRHMKRLLGHAGIGHVRYPTAGCASSFEAQPFYVNAPYGIALAHNGNLTNADELSRIVRDEDLRHLNTTSDSEILLNVLAHELVSLKKPQKDITPDDIFTAIKGVFKRCKGGFAVVAMIMGKGIVAFRDPNGIRPLCYGKRTLSTGEEYAVSSETVALDALDFKPLGDVPPGGMLFLPFEGGIEKKFPDEETIYKNFAPCLFEYVYLARPDSIIDGVSVYRARLRMGRSLAKKVLKTLPKGSIDVVIPIPDSGRTAAIDLAHEIGAKYREGFIKNRYVGRTFIMPGQEIRKKSVRQKLNTAPFEFKGKNVLLVDDSIVRGTTSQRIIEMAREAGAKKVYFASAAPAVRFPNVYGIDLPARSDLIASGADEEIIAKIIGADAVFYQDLEDLKDSILEGNSKIQQFDASCFDGKYVTGDIDEEYLQKLEKSRQQSENKISDNTFHEEEPLTDSEPCLPSMGFL